MPYQHTLTLQTEPCRNPPTQYTCNPATWLLRYLEALMEGREVLLIDNRRGKYGHHSCNHHFFSTNPH